MTYLEYTREEVTEKLQNRVTSISNDHQAGTVSDALTHSFNYSGLSVDLFTIR